MVRNLCQKTCEFRVKKKCENISFKSFHIRNSFTVRCLQNEQNLFKGGTFKGINNCRFWHFPLNLVAVTNRKFLYLQKLPHPPLSAETDKNREIKSTRNTLKWGQPQNLIHAKFNF